MITVSCFTNFPSFYEMILWHDYRQNGDIKDPFCHRYLTTKVGVAPILFQDRQGKMIGGGIICHQAFRLTLETGYLHMTSSAKGEVVSTLTKILKLEVLRQSDDACSETFMVQSIIVATVEVSDEVIFPLDVVDIIDLENGVHTNERFEDRGGPIKVTYQKPSAQEMNF